MAGRFFTPEPPGKPQHRTDWHKQDPPRPHECLRGGAHSRLTHPTGRTDKHHQQTPVSKRQKPEAGHAASEDCCPLAQEWSCPQAKGLLGPEPSRGSCPQTLRCSEACSDCSTRLSTGLQGPACSCLNKSFFIISLPLPRVNPFRDEQATPRP